ncbi:cyclin-dependent kinase inhibitor 3-like isoform X2 [Dreissena polymorpha]|uniref:cyclin-dependent kinase inhibitor 3-like isoform X2 n=1 Tax=Dreissena polymorpha TaxID=45954 RepID=UPI00226414D1|nr:cyclin-dependent kinase inhibitor 3-like isoform X2 [Dreissena polymorpha]
MSGFESSDEEGEVDVSPFLISWLDLGLGEHEDKLAISSLPECLQAEGVDSVLCLCTKGELNKYRVPGLLSELELANIDVHHYPYLDGTAPNIRTMLQIVDEILMLVKKGSKPLVHCFGGLGRSCLVAVCTMLVIDESLTAEQAIEKVRGLRGPGAIQSVQQYNYACEFRNLCNSYKQEQDENARSLSR